MQRCQILKLQRIWSASGFTENENRWRSRPSIGTISFHVTFALLSDIYLFIRLDSLTNSVSYIRYKLFLAMNLKYLDDSTLGSRSMTSLTTPLDVLL